MHPVQKAVYCQGKYKTHKFSYLAMVNENGENIASTLWNIKITSNQNALTDQKD